MNRMREKSKMNGDDDNLCRNLLIILGLLLVSNLVISSIALYKKNKDNKDKEGYSSYSSNILSNNIYNSTSDPSYANPAFCRRDLTYGWEKLVDMKDFGRDFLNDGRKYEASGGWSNKIKTFQMITGDNFTILLDGDPYKAYFDTFCDYPSKGVLINYSKQKIYGFTTPENPGKIYDWIYIFDIDMNNSTSLENIKNYIETADDTDNARAAPDLNFRFNSSPNSEFVKVKS